MDLDQTITKIIQNPLFLRLKTIIENNPYHDKEDVYSHSVKTVNTAKEQIEASFITSIEAKELFQQFTDEEIAGLKRRDIMVLIALLHDIGKILAVSEDGQTSPILATNSEGRTFCPGHEYWGSTIVPEVLKDLSLPEEVVGYIAKIIKLHDSFGDVYWNSKKDWSFDFILNDVKSRAEGFYKEALFNIYCDCFSAEPFAFGREMIVKVFNDPKLYIKRIYAI